MTTVKNMFGYLSVQTLKELMFTRLNSVERIQYEFIYNYVRDGFTCLWENGDICS